MFQVLSLVALLGLALCVLPSHRTMAQQFSVSDVVYEAARNKIGLMRYCRNNELLAPALADQAVSTVEIGLRKLPSSDIFAREQGDRAEQAGEDGFWEAGRRRDIASVGKLFGATPADLCKEWAGETLRAQAPRRSRAIETTIAIATPPTQPLPQAAPRSVGPIQLDERPARATTVEKTARSAPPLPTPPLATPSLATPSLVTPPLVSPPLPVKAPFLPPEAEAAWQRTSLQRTWPTAGNIPSSGIAPSAAPQPSGPAASLSARLASEAASEPPREQTGTAAVPSPRLDDDPSPPLLEKSPFNKLGRPQRCLMAGCKWTTPQERRYW
jgi:hypothetical protein